MVASNTTTNCATHNNPSACHRRSCLFLSKPFMVVTEDPLFGWIQTGKMMFDGNTRAHREVKDSWWGHCARLRQHGRRGPACGVPAGLWGSGSLERAGWPWTAGEGERRLAEASHKPEDAEAVYRDALRLCGALYGVFCAVAEGRVPASISLEILRGYGQREALARGRLCRPQEDSPGSGRMSGT